jgi:hypothetical protein
VDLAALAEAAQREVVCTRSVRVAVDRFVRDVQAGAERETFELGTGALEESPRTTGLVVGKVREDFQP